MNNKWDITINKVEDLQAVECCHFSRTILGETIFALFGEVDSYTKRVPKMILTGTKEQICCFLRGYFSGDGSIHLSQTRNKNGDRYYMISCASINRALLEDISTLLDRLGIKHNIQEPYTTGGFKNAKPCYKLSIECEHDV